MLGIQNTMNWNATTRAQFLEQHKDLTKEQKQAAFDSLNQVGRFFEAAAVVSSLRGLSDVPNLCANLSSEQIRGIAVPLVKEGFYNTAAEIAESERDVSFTDYVYGEISMYGAEKNDLFLVRQFAGSMQNIKEKDVILDRATRVMIRKGPTWTKSADLKEIISMVSDKEKKASLDAYCKAAYSMKDLITKRQNDPQTH